LVSSKEQGRKIRENISKVQSTAEENHPVNKVIR
jgi:hypothetical protein